MARTEWSESAAGPDVQPLRRLDDLTARDDLTDRDWQEYLSQLEPHDVRALAVTLPVIEQAKGVLVGYYGCDTGAAFNVLRHWSTSRNVKLRTVAAAVVAAAAQPSAEPFGVLREFLAGADPGPLPPR